jgi:hypothetical protein
MTTPARTGRRRGHGEGSYYRTAGGEWRGAVTYQKSNGEKARKYFQAPTKRAVMDAVRQWQAGGRRDLTNKVTVADFLDRWLSDAISGTVKKTTLQGYRNNATRIVRELGAFRLAELRPEHVQAAQRRMLE